MEQVFDVAVIGGGINGCGIAADAAIRGLSVILIEKDDLASKTSSNSSKLIHGGLRYLEYFDFSLVKKALDERQLLLTLAPHLVYPLSFVLPYQQHMRPSWLLRTGLFLYDNLSRKNRLPRSQLIKRSQQSAYFSPLTESFNKGFLFYDCATDDARLTLENALQAKEYGASIHPGTELIAAETINNLWQLSVKTRSGECRTIKARALINSTGPWAEAVNTRLHIANKYKLSLVKGSHLVVHKLYEGNHAYLLQNNDKRIIFIIPYHDHTIVGTTDVAFNSSLDDINISASEVDYLCNLVNNYLKCQLQKKDIIETWSGVRPLLAVEGEEPKALSRDYALAYTQDPAPSVTIYGGKITTYRQAALETVNQLKHLFPHLKESETDHLPLPGAKFADYSYKEYLVQASEKYYWLDEELKERYFRSYGTRTEIILEGCSKTADLGYHFGSGLYQKEVDYLRDEEWAHDCEDILWRRTKLGLNFEAENKEALADYLNNRGKH